MKTIRTTPIIWSFLLIGGFFSDLSEAFEIKGISLTSWGLNGYGEQESMKTLRWIQCLGATDVAIVTENQVDPSTGRVFNKPSLTGPDKKLEETIRYARSLGLRVTLKPAYSNSKTDNHLAYPPFDPIDSFQFFFDYKENLLKHATLAEKTGVDRLVIGTELGGQLTGQKYRIMWQSIIQNVRSVFHGKLTYAATFDTEYKRSLGANEVAYVSFWNLLDEIGINVYPKLTKEQNPSQDVLEKNFRSNTAGDDLVEQLKIRVKQSGKPAIILETGARSIAANFWETGSWTGTTQAIDLDAQTRLLAASLNVWNREGSGWLKGLFLWEALAYPKNNNNRVWIDRGFSFQGKPAENLVRHIYSESITQSNCAE